MKNQKVILKKVAIFIGIIEAFSIGVINSSYSSTRWPTSSGINLLLDFFIVSFSNPYALLSGLLAFLTLNRWAEKIEEIRVGKNDLVIFLLIGILIILSWVLMKGIIVY